MGFKYDFLIVGAGPFGSTFAHLATKNGKKCLVIDKRSHIGGNCYTQNIEGVEETCKEVLQNNFPTYEWKIWIDEDANWDIYFNFLYPDIFSYQVMQNRKVLQKLEEDNDNLKNNRKIDHWLYFINEESVNEFVNKVKKIGYTILSSEKIDNGKYPYQVNIAREDAPININNITWELVDLANQLKGYYDGWGCVLAKD